MVDVHGRYLSSLERTAAQPGARVPADRRRAGRARRGRRAGWSPEFAVLLAYTKIGIDQELLASELPEDPFLSGELDRYFPTRLRQRYGASSPPPAAPGDHRPVCRTCWSTGPEPRSRSASPRRSAPAPHIARAHTAAWEIFGLRGLWSGDRGARRPRLAETQIGMLLKVRMLPERASRWLLRNRRQAAGHRSTVERYAAGRSGARRGDPGAARRSEPKPRREGAALAGDGVPAELATASRSRALVPTIEPWRPRRRSSWTRGVAGRLLRARRAPGAGLAERADPRAAPGRRGGRRWRVPRCATTCTPCGPG